MLINRTNIFEITKNLNLKPEKDYGQNFLVESEIASRIVERLEINEKDKILEIGPGLGSLTHFISLKSSPCDAVDIDFRMIKFLEEIYGGSSVIKLINNDVRKVDISKYSKIIGNLPYNITTELITFLLLNGKSCQKLVLMCQAEAFARFSASTGSDYGAVSVLVHLLGESKKLFVVKAGSFYPAPKCESIVFELQLNGKICRDDCYDTYFLAKTLFLNRRKTILNNLSLFLKDRPSAEKICFDLGIRTTLRPEQLTPFQYLAIYKTIKLNATIKKD
jgi:16S rRNA (adenine1518-N6/adenine1519-N6)-dimethyltransferase